MPEVQHRSKIEFNIWVEDKNSIDYYLMENQFINCFTSVEVKYKTVYKDKTNGDHNYIVIPIENYSDLPESVSTRLTAFSRDNDIPIIFACGSRNLTHWESIKFWYENNKIPNAKLFLNGLDSPEKNIIAVPSYISKLYNWYGPALEDEFLHAFSVLSEKIHFKLSMPFGKITYTKKLVIKEILEQGLLDKLEPHDYWYTCHSDKEDLEQQKLMVPQYNEDSWWACYPWQQKSTCLNLAIEDTSIPTITEHILKPLMLGQPTVWVGHPKLIEQLHKLGFVTYPWMCYDFDYAGDIKQRIAALVEEIERQTRRPDFINFIRKRSYWTNRKNKTHFNKLAKEDYCLEKFLAKIK